MTTRNKYWFKPKRYGWGYVPVTWEGWALTFGLIILIYVVMDLFMFVGVIQYLIMGLLIFCFHKIAKPRTDGEVKWNWGAPKN